MLQGLKMGKLKYIAAAFALAASTPTLAAALLGDVVKVSDDSINYLYGNYYGDLHLSGHSALNDVPAGEFLFKGTDITQHASFRTTSFCVDLFKEVDEGTYIIDPLSQIISNVTKQKQLAALVTHADSVILASTNKNATAVAFQLAIWEVEYETGTSGYNVATGRFYANGHEDGALNSFTGQQAEANKYLKYVTNGTWMASVNSARLLYSSESQSQIYAVPTSAIPEPATWLTMILGFGLVGAFVRRRRAMGIAVA